MAAKASGRFQEVWVGREQEKGRTGRTQKGPSFEEKAGCAQ